MNLVILLIGYRILNLAETHVSLALLTQNNLPSATVHGFWLRFGRRAFLIGATLPLYILLLLSTQDRLIQGIATILVTHTVLAELSSIYYVTSFEVRRDWPHHLLVMGSADHLTQEYVANEDKASGAERETEHSIITSTDASRDSLCDRVHQLSPLAAQPNDTSASHSFTLQKHPKLKKLLYPDATARWTCGHWRCLIYMVLHIAVQAIGLFWSVFELVSTTWLLNWEVDPVTLRLAGKILEVDILGGVLATLYDICTALFIFIFAYIASMVLVIRLITRLPNRIHILQRMQQKFQGLAETAPGIHRVLKALLIHAIPVTSSYYGSLALVPRVMGLTKGKLSFIFNIIVILTLYITAYCLPVGSDPASTKPDVAPGKQFQGPQDLDTTVSGSTHSDDEKELLRMESGYPRTRKEFRSAIFRLAIVVPTLTVWIFFYR
ncbi:hypothetical protein AbraIFM66950_002242 [Aspergillus brasiliensis]|nr:hypothetical protein AbraIFM66950_002242 [Aspergillus brasiliensis]